MQNPRARGRTLVVGRPTASATGGWYRLGAALRVEGNARLEAHQADIWFSLPAEHADAFVLPDCSDCFLLGLLSDGTLKIVPYGTNKKRLEKTRAIADYRPAQLRLNVCNSVSTLEKNCSACSKCRRSMLELELLGKLDLFGEAFDIDAYRKKFKSRDFAELLYPPPEYKNPFLHDARRYAMAHGIDIGSHSTAMDRICAYMHQTWIYRFLKALSLLGVVKRILGRK